MSPLAPRPSMNSYSHEVDLSPQDHAGVQDLLTEFALDMALTVTPHKLRDEFKDIAIVQSLQRTSAQVVNPSIVIRGERSFGEADSMPIYDFFAVLPLPSHSGRPLIISTPSNTQMLGEGVANAYVLNARDKVDDGHSEIDFGQVLHEIANLTGDKNIAELAHPRNQYSVHAAMVLLSKCLAPVAGRRDRASRYLGGDILMSYIPETDGIYMSEYGVQLEVLQKTNPQKNRILLSALGTLSLLEGEVIQQFRYNYNVGVNERPVVFLDLWSDDLDKDELALLASTTKLDSDSIVAKAIEQLSAPNFS